MNEQIIQDAAGTPERLLKIANEVLNLGLTTSESDVVTLEYSFPGGRIDILGMLGPSLLLVEVKQDIASASAVDQLWGYLAKRAELNLPEKTGSTPAVGIVIAQGFDARAHRRAMECGVRLVEFRLERGRFPFRVPEVPNGREEPESEAPVSRTSELLTVESHIQVIKSPGLQELYRRFSRLFIPDGIDGAASPEDQERRAWVCPSVKKAHVWVRYKGQGVVCLWAKRKTFLVGYVGADTKWKYVGDAGVFTPADLEEIQTGIQKRTQTIDEELRSALGQFRWTDLQSDHGR